MIVLGEVPVVPVIIPEKGLALDQKRIIAIVLKDGLAEVQGIVLREVLKGVKIRATKDRKTVVSETSLKAQRKRASLPTAVLEILVNPVNQGKEVRDDQINVVGLRIRALVVLLNRVNPRKSPTKHLIKKVTRIATECLRIKVIKIQTMNKLKKM